MLKAKLVVKQGQKVMGLFMIGKDRQTAQKSDISACMPKRILVCLIAL